MVVVPGVVVAAVAVAVAVMVVLVWCCVAARVFGTVGILYLFRSNYCSRVQR